jgi:hypothetical protein
MNRAAMNSPLVDYSLKGLERCWQSQHGRWSHIYHLDGRDPPNQSVPYSDVFYTINVLLGLARVQNIPHDINLPETFRRNVSQLVALPVAKYAFGCALWASAELKLELPNNVSLHIGALLGNKENWLTFRAQDLGMILTGVVAQAKMDAKKWSLVARDLFAFLAERYQSASGLFCDASHGPRRRYASFATQTYLTIACYAYGEYANDENAIELANKCVRRLIALQGPNGEWPWFFDAFSGLVLDFYEIYSVHQYGMAPAFLQLAENHGVLGAREALTRGFYWVLGKNQLSIPMLVSELSLTIRSQVRKGELKTSKWRALRAMRNSILRRGTSLADPSRLELRRECRSYELGWILWSFGQRMDMPELTHHPLFLGTARRVG